MGSIDFLCVRTLQVMLGHCSFSIEDSSLWWIKLIHEIKNCNK